MRLRLFHVVYNPYSIGVELYAAHRRPQLAQSPIRSAPGATHGKLLKYISEDLLGVLWRKIPQEQNQGATTGVRPVCWLPGPVAAMKVFLEQDKFAPVRAETSSGPRSSFVG
jgi:hypothetical protein